MLVASEVMWTTTKFTSYFLTTCPYSILYPILHHLKLLLSLFLALKRSDTSELTSQILSDFCFFISCFNLFGESINLNTLHNYAHIPTTYAHIHIWLTYLNNLIDLHVSLYIILFRHVCPNSYMLCSLLPYITCQFLRMNDLSLTKDDFCCQLAP